MNPDGAVRRVATPALLTATLLSAPALLALHFRDGPPARVTGGHGEDTCVACHFGNALNDPAGTLTLDGFPERYTPGGTYDLELTLARPEARAAGFQLAVRLDTGDTQAGAFELPAESAAHVALQQSRGIQFVQHRGSDARSWKFAWTAPMTAGDVVLHAAAVAGDGDESQAGDHVYTIEARSERECPCREDDRQP